MKETKYFWALLATCLGAIILAGCSTTGSPPTAFEQKFFDVKTNVLEITVLKTNIVPITTYTTNEITITVTNKHGVTEYQTNLVLVPKVVLQEVIQPFTNRVPYYDWTPSTNANQIAQTGGAIGGLFGYGGLISTGLLGIFGIWAKMRSSRNYATAANMAQTIETIRSFVQSLPRGAEYDAALVQWMQAHQAEAGVLDQVLEILKNDVSNPDARFAAQQLDAALHALQTPAPPAPPKV